MKKDGFGNPIPLENIKQLSELSGNLIKVIITETKEDENVEKEEKGQPLIPIFIAVFIIVLLVVLRKKKGGK